VETRIFAVDLSDYPTGLIDVEGVFGLVTWNPRRIQRVVEYKGSCGSKSYLFTRTVINKNNWPREKKHREGLITQWLKAVFLISIFGHKCREQKCENFMHFGACA
jgi:hypothetical protein